MLWNRLRIVSRACSTTSSMSVKSVWKPTFPSSNRLFLQPFSSKPSAPAKGPNPSKGDNKTTEKTQKKKKMKEKGSKSNDTRSNSNEIPNEKKTTTHLKLLSKRIDSGERISLTRLGEFFQEKRKFIEKVEITLGWKLISKAYPPRGVMTPAHEALLAITHKKIRKCDTMAISSMLLCMGKAGALRGGEIPPLPLSFDAKFDVMEQLKSSFENPRKFPSAIGLAELLHGMSLCKFAPLVKEDVEFHEMLNNIIFAMDKPMTAFQCSKTCLALSELEIPYHPEFQEYLVEWFQAQHANSLSLRSLEDFMFAFQLQRTTPHHQILKKMQQALDIKAKQNNTGELNVERGSEDGSEETGNKDIIEKPQVEDDKSEIDMGDVVSSDAKVEMKDNVMDATKEEMKDATKKKDSTGKTDTEKIAQIQAWLNSCSTTSSIST